MVRKLSISRGTVNVVAVAESAAFDVCENKFATRDVAYTALPKIDALSAQKEIGWLTEGIAYMTQ